MARIRYLKPDFWKDEDIADLPYEIRLCFQGLWNFADKEGRLEDRPKNLKVQIFPYDKIDMNSFLDKLATPKNNSNRPYIQRYEIDGEKYIQIINWHKHQKPHHTEKDSVIPPPPPLKIKGMEKIKQDEASRELRNGELTVKRPLIPQIDFITALKTNPAYKHIDIDRELGKMDAWLLAHKGRKKTERFIVHWINKIDRVVEETPKRKEEPPQPKTQKEIDEFYGKE